MKTIAIAIVGMILFLPGCTKELEPEQKLLKYLTATQDSPRSFLYTESPKTSIRELTSDLNGAREHFTVTGKVEDDLRVSAKLRVGEVEVLEQTISEDTLAVRVVDPSKVPGLGGGPVGGSMIVGDALRSGKWVLDYAGAPPLIAQRTREGAIKVGEKPLLDAVYVFQYFRRAIDEAQSVELFNKDLVTYDPREDPFPQPKEEAGEQRYDLAAPPLPRRSARGTASGLPGASNFRKMVFYVKGGKVIEVREEIEYENHRDFRRALEGRGPKYPLTLLAAVRAGKGREPVRVRTMSYRASNIGDEKLKVTLPTDFLAANLAGTFGPQGITLQGQQDVQPSQPPAASPTP